MVMTEKEHIVIHYAVLLPIVKKVLALDTQALKSSGVRLQGPYERLFQQAFDALQYDLYQLRLYMQKKNMQIVFEENDGVFTHYVYYYNSGSGRTSHLNANLKKQTERCLHLYFSGRSALTDDDVLHPASV
ncbi:hypothetical protein SAMN05421781_2066 [Marinococcus luteus]|uniref:Uncharacterized protein n=1 Tax=Marinococcus luteus TaxID=1122204 RepID=A0A1H2VFJ0_9BACI|nr:hypothetical protein [Marinococcus luteus]SDW67097.1 hypothetical protein SAMN05421781_2066 [Marinococcus luteus]